MTKAIVVSALVVFVLSHLSPPCVANDREIGRILAAAESHFQAMERMLYPAIWGLLTERSKNTIIREVQKNSNGVYTEEQIATDLTMGGIIARSYWHGFLDTFEPEMVLEESRWEMGKIKGHKAEIIITYSKNAGRPAILRMYKEDDRWKVGLVETFWSRR
ncbi:MAG: hypothetical protein GY721_04780 [Deltaproteobacteria bacterium]|nr:hypothetical protein [Deltaproteobacteria bacterium]